jgi:hypothetical protein
MCYCAVYSFKIIVGVTIPRTFEDRRSVYVRILECSYLRGCEALLLSEAILIAERLKKVTYYKLTIAALW